MVKETATQRKRRLEKTKQKRQEKLPQEPEAGRSARLAKRRKRAEASLPQICQDKSASLQQVNEGFDVTMERTCSKLAVQTHCKL
ncbi:hypothetical protein AVEN_13762-1 [Araneus ventricosus]|uniref:Uncharacterized protein n=1 Tax=Araneus ventricosus TaxID=182803 RepID=A0A4Y2MRQ0_ARAVE|nr:hypothetical protein AVEN_13762-1 [Araneus ventricosus]